MKKLSYFLLLFLLNLHAKSTHIVGGFISYRYISDSTYEIKLFVYRDCNAPTIFDGEEDQNGNVITPARIFVFNSTGSIVRTINLNAPIVSQVLPPLDNPCLTNTSGVCVEQGVYTQIYTLPSANSGYTLAYVRCCRNGSVNNLVNPGGQGGTYSAYVPPSSSFQNSSPVFSSFPPIFICLNAPLGFNHSATDSDGDSLVYSLCTPFTGGDTIDPVPQFPFGPPFPNIIWGSGYSASNPLGANSLNIDPTSGYLTGTPTTTGQFVVGVCVSEYRNGQLIGTYLRDFQFNVTQCNIPIANIPSTDINPNTGIGYVVNCNSLTVTFQNASYNPPPTSFPLRYEWDFGVSGTNSDTSSQRFPVYTFPDTGTYLVRLIATKSGGTQSCADTTFAYVKLYPTFQTDFSTFNICQDSAARFIDLTLSTSGPVSQWSWNFGDGSTSTSPNPTHQYSTPGTYNVRLINQNDKGCKDTMQRSITIYELPVASFTYGTTCVNSPVSFTNTSTGPFSALSWNLGNGTSSTVANPTTTYTTPGNYSVSLFLVSPNGCKDTSIQNVTIRPLPTVNITGDTLICPLTSVQLFASGGVSYSWSPTSDFNNANIANPVATPSSATPVVYTVSVTDQFQCSNTDSVLVSFYPMPNIDAGSDTSVCLNPGSFRDSVGLQATGGVSYLWSPSSGLSATNIANPISRPPFNIVYYVEGTDANGCKLTDSVAVYFLDPALNLIIEDHETICEKDTVFVNVINQGASAYFWSPNLFLTNPTIYNPGFFPPDTTLYTLTVSNYCYTKSDSVLIAVNPLPPLNLNPLDSICLFDSIQLNVNGAQTYQWDNHSTLSATNIPNPIATPIGNTWYYVTGTSDLGCVNRDSTLILVYLPSVISVLPDTPFICFGSSIQLNAAGAYSYVWTPAATLSSGNVANPIATPIDTTTYSVEATNIHGCKTYDSVTINVQHPVTAITESPVNGCEGVPVQLRASGGFYYEWTPSIGLNNPFTNQPFANPGLSTIYIVKVSNDCFSDTAIAEVIVHPLPSVNAGNDTTIWRDTYAQLSGFTTEANYFWNPSTWLDDPFDLNTKASPQQTQWYELFAIDEYGCMNKDSVLIRVEPYTVLDIPTAFSPDGNGMNDIFRIARWLNIYDLKSFAVYNRWGQRVFETNNLTDGWDGTYKGEKCELGVYVWVVLALTKDREEIVRKGNVTLLR